MDKFKSLNDQARSLCRSQKYRLALRPAQESIEIATATFGESCLILADSLDLLARIYDSLETNKELEFKSQVLPLRHRALAIREKHLKPDDPAIAESLLLLGITLIGRKQFTEAEPVFVRALTVYESRPGTESDQIALCLNYIALCLIERMEFDVAESLCDRSRALFSEAEKLQSLTYLQLLKTLKELYSRTNRPQLAAKYEKDWCDFYDRLGF